MCNESVDTVCLQYYVIIYFCILISELNVSKQEHLSQIVERH